MNATISSHCVKLDAHSAFLTDFRQLFSVREGLVSNLTHILCYIILSGASIETDCRRRRGDAKIKKKKHILPFAPIHGCVSVLKCVFKQSSTVLMFMA